jgi:hypothetical protein
VAGHEMAMPDSSIAEEIELFLFFITFATVQLIVQCLQESQSLGINRPEAKVDIFPPSPSCKVEEH